MRFLKNIIGAVLTSFFLVFLLSSCEHNVCDNVVCQHGGSCDAGLCRCPTGYEGAQCQTLISARYLGKYGGYMKCDGLADVYDTVDITQSTKGLLYVDVDVKSLRPKLLHGYVTSSSSVYAITIINNDSTHTDTTHYYRTFSVTLQSDKTLSVASVEDLSTPADTAIHKCTFLSDHKLQ